MARNFLVEKGIRLSFNASSGAPEIPHVQDVLYALRRTDEQTAFDFCAAYHEVYIQNVMLVAAIVAVDLLRAEYLSEQEARRCVAQRILELTPDYVCYHHGPSAIHEAVAEIQPHGLLGLRVVVTCSILVNACKCQDCKAKAARNPDP